MLVARIRPFLAGLLLLGLSACAASAPVLGTGVTAMRASVSEAKTATGEAFDDINQARRDFTVEDVLDAAAKEPDFRLTDKEFAPVIDAETAGRWRAAFDQIDNYLAGLQNLVDAKRSADTNDQLIAIGEGLQSETIGVKLPKGSAELFAALGSALVQAVAEQKALAIMRRTDPAFGRLMRKMGDLASGGDGALSSIMMTQWKRRLDDIAADEFGAARQAGARDGMTTAIIAYGKALDDRNAKLQALASLRDSLLALGEAHKAASEGADGALLYWIGQIDSRLQDARDAAGNGGE